MKRLFCLVLLVFFLTACGDDSPSQAPQTSLPPPTPPPVDIPSRESRSHLDELLSTDPGIAEMVEGIRNDTGHLCFLPFSSLLRVHEASLLDRLQVLPGTELEDVEALVSQGKIQEAIWSLVDLGDAGSLVRAQELRGQLAEILLEEPEAIQEARDSGVLGGSLPKFLVTFRNGVQGVFKPDLSNAVRQRYATWNFWYSDSGAEVAAYLLDLELETDVVPMTVIRNVNGMRGSLQYFVSDMEDGSFDSLAAANFKEFLVFDFFARAADRKLPNFLYSRRKNQVVAIDNGGCFDMSRGNRPSFDPVGSVEDTVEILMKTPHQQRTVRNLSGERIRELLQLYLPTDEIEEVVNRIDAVRGVLLAS